MTVTDDAANADTLVKQKPLGDLRGGRLANISLPAPTGDVTLHFDDNSMDELWLAAAWGA